jgi:hypothetical protein
MRRITKALKWTGIVLGAVVAIPLIANACFVLAANARLEQQLAAIRQAGDPLTLAELARKPVSPKNNAATYLRRAKSDVTAVRDEIEVAEINVFLYHEPQCVYPVPAIVRETVESALDAYPKVIPLLEQAAACSDYNAQLNFAIPPQECVTQIVEITRDIRNFARVLYYRTCMLVAQGKHDEAVRSALAIFRLARHCERNPTMMGQLGAITVEGYAINAASFALETGPVSEKVRKELDAECSLCESLDGYMSAIKTERALVLDLLHASPARNASEFLDETDVFLKFARDSTLYCDAEKVIDKMPKRTWYNLPAHYSCDDVDFCKATYQAVTRLRATIRCLRILNALQVHAAAGGAELPKLTELGLPAETTVDPFNGKPLQIKKLPQGWLVYSVGLDLKDDGGKLDHCSDVGVGPPMPSGKPGEPSKQ